MPSLRKLLKCSVSLLVLFFANVATDIACGPEPDPYDYYISYFHNNLSATQQYEPFYFTGYTFLYHENEPGNEQQTNIAEWVHYLGKGVKPDDALQALYNIDSTTNAHLQGTAKLPDSLTKNSFFNALAHNKKALAYYLFAKKAEPLCVVTNQWDPTPRDTTAMVAMAAQAEKAVAGVHDNFLKLRYLYQAQRMLRYSGQTQQAADLYNQAIAPIKTDSYIKYLAMMQQGGAELRLGNAAKSAYLFSLVFAALPERRIQAYRNYNWAEANVADVLKLAQNDQEKANIYAINGFHSAHFEINSLTEIYGCQPTSSLIGILLAREVNKLEEVYLDPAVKASNDKLGIANPNFSFGVDSSAVTVKKHIADIKQFCNLLASDKKNADYALGYIIPAYLAWMQKDTRSGLAYMDKLNGVKMRQPIFEQKQIITLLLKAQGIAQLNDINETSLLPLLQWLDKRVGQEKKVKTNPNSYHNWSYYGSRPFASTARNFYQTVLANAYVKQGNIAKAAAAMVKGDTDTAAMQYPGQTADFLHHYLKPAQLKQLIAWKTNSPNNPYLHLLTSNLTSYSNSDLNNLLGLTYLREHNYAAAIKVLQQVKKSTLNDFPGHGGYWGTKEEYGADPFVNQLHDYPKKYYNSDSSAYNRLQFAQAMLKLQQQMKAQPQNPQSYYQYATGLYNTSMYGNAWYLISNTWAAADYGRRSIYYYDADFVRAAEAEKYYLMARQHSNNAEYKAKCTYMAAKCRQKSYVIPEYDYTEPDDVRDRKQSSYYKQVRTNPYFNHLKTTYGKTAYYKTAVNECSYLRDFLTGKTSPPKEKRETVTVN